MIVKLVSSWKPLFLVVCLFLAGPATVWAQFDDEPPESVDAEAELEASSVDAKVKLDVAAPELQAEDAGSSSSGFMLEEVMVTARKTSESLQDTPVAVTAMSGQALEDAGVSNLSNLNGAVPGLFLENGSGTGGAATPFIRGVGQRENKATLDPAVAIYMDGVYLGRPDGGLMDILDIAAVEVLRGPQGTLFGKNATGGALVLTTNRPSEEFEGLVMGRVGDFNRRDAQFMVNVPITDDLYTRFAYSTVSRDGYTLNLTTGNEHDLEDRETIYAQARYVIDDFNTFDVAMSWGRQDERGRGQTCLVDKDTTPEELPPITGTVSGSEGGWGFLEVPYISGETLAEWLGRAIQLEGAATPADIDFIAACREEMGLPKYQFYQSLDGEYSVKARSLAGTYTSDMGEYELGDFFSFDSLELKSITALRYVSVTETGDIDGGAFPFIDRRMDHPRETSQFTQEFTLVGMALDSQLTITAGLFYWQEQTENGIEVATTGPFYAPYVGENSRITTPFLEAGALIYGNTVTSRKTDNKSWSTYTQFTYDYTEDLQFTFGLRYTTETRKLTSVRGGNVPVETTPYPGTSTIALPGFPVFILLGPRGLENYDFDRFVEIELNPPDSDTRSDDAWTPMANITYFLEGDLLETLYLDSAMTYFTYSKGFRSGGFVTPQVGEPAIQKFKSEKVKNYELGLKLEAMDSRLRANMAAFLMKYTDIQLTNSYQPAGNLLPIVKLGNAGQAEISGFEAEITFLPLEFMQVSFNLTYTDAGYDEYLVESGVPCDFIGQEGCGPLNYREVIIDRSGEDMPWVSRWTHFFAVQGTLVSPIGYITPRLEIVSKTAMSGHFDNISWDQGLWEVDGFTTYNVRVSLDLPNEQTRVALYGKNLSDVYYFNGGIPTPGVTGAGGATMAAPRMYGIEVFHNF